MEGAEEPQSPQFLEHVEVVVVVEEGAHNFARTLAVDDLVQKSHPTGYKEVALVADSIHPMMMTTT